MLFQRAPQSVEIRFKDKKHKQPLSPVGRLANFLSSFLVPPSDSFQEEIKVNQLYSAKGERALTTLRAWEVETPSPSFLLPVGAVGLKALVLPHPAIKGAPKVYPFLLTGRGLVSQQEGSGWGFASWESLVR